MFMIVFLAYAQLGCLLFGTSHPDFKDMITSIITLMRMFLGDFDYNMLERANYILGPIYFVSYILLVFFILLVNEIQQQKDSPMTVIKQIILFVSIPSFFIEYVSGYY